MHLELEPSIMFFLPVGNVPIKVGILGLTVYNLHNTITSSLSDHDT